MLAHQRVTPESVVLETPFQVLAITVESQPLFLPCLRSPPGCSHFDGLGGPWPCRFCVNVLVLAKSRENRSSNLVLTLHKIATTKSSLNDAFLSKEVRAEASAMLAQSTGCQDHPGCGLPSAHLGL